MLSEETKPKESDEYIIKCSELDLLITELQQFYTLFLHLIKDLGEMPFSMSLEILKKFQQIILDYKEKRRANE